MSNTPSNPILIIPAHNEEKNIGQVLTDVRATGLALDVVVIDDFSSDNTARVAAGYGARVVRLPSNLGYGGAVQTGFRYAVEWGYQYGVMMDADGQHVAAYIPALLAVVCEGGADVAIGSRFLGRMAYHTSWIKRVGMGVFSQIVSRVTGYVITDATSGFQALNRDAMTFFSRDNYPTDFPDADTILLLHFAGFRVREVPVTMCERLSGVSMHSSWKPIYYVFKMFLAIFIVLLRQGTHISARRPAKAAVEGELPSHA